MPRASVRSGAPGGVSRDLRSAASGARSAERIVLVGDFNAFEFSDGYVDVIGAVTGTPAPVDQVAAPGRDGRRAALR